jgi:hypothetical protein
VLPGRKYSFADVTGLLLSYKWLLILPPSIGLAAASATNDRRVAIAGPLCGLLIGLALVAAREYRDVSFSSEQDVSSVLMLPVLGQVSNMASENERRWRGFRRLAKSLFGYLVVLSSIAAFLLSRLS